MACGTLRSSDNKKPLFLCIVLLDALALVIQYVPDLQFPLLLVVCGITILFGLCSLSEESGIKTSFILCAGAVPFFLVDSWTMDHRTKLTFVACPTILVMVEIFVSL